MKRRDEVSVGILITAAVTILLLGTLWLVRGGLKSGYPLYTRFDWGQNLKQGQPVLLAGVNVGYVSDVDLRREGYLDVSMRIDDKYTVPKGSTATVKAIGIFGDVAVALTPPTPTPAANYAAGDTVPPGIPAADVNQIMTRVDSIGQSVSVLLQAMQQQIIAAGTLKDLSKTMASTAALSAQLQQVVTEQNKNVTATLDEFRKSAARVGRVLDSAEISATVANLKKTTDNATRLVANIDSTNAQIRTLLVQAQSGNGTVGKLLSDSLLYADARRLMTTLDSLVADFKKNPRKYINLSIF